MYTHMCLNMLTCVYIGHRGEGRVCVMGLRDYRDLLDCFWFTSYLYKPYTSILVFFLPLQTLYKYLPRSSRWLT